MKTRILVFLIGVALLHLNAPILTAQGGGPGRAGMGPMNPSMNNSQAAPDRAGMGIPNLTDEQKDQIKKLRMTQMKEVQPIRNEMMELKARFHTLSTAENPDNNEINKNIDARTALMNKLMKSKASHHQAVRKILNEEQKLFFDNRQMNNKGRNQGNKGPWNMDCRP